MSTRGNDAIPSWSGFNFQGKTMLLIIIQHINSIMDNNENIDDYKVNIEQYEDFVVFNNNEATDLYQVKAVLSKSKWEDYCLAMDKLNEHKTLLQASTAKCHLVSANEIVNWNEECNLYKSTIDLYKYNKLHVSVIGVSNLIKKEIETLLNKKAEYDSNKVEIVYLGLCEFIDACIANMHYAGRRNRKYDVSYSDFINEIDKLLESSEASQMAYLKEEVYKHITNDILEALNSVCDKECNKNSDECIKKCPAKEAYIKILELPDIYKYLKIINPTKNKKWKPLHYVSNATKDEFERIVFELFYKCNDWQSVVSHDYSVKIKSKFSNATNKTIIPTLIKMTDDSRIQKTVQSIYDNHDILDYLYGNSLTVDTCNPFTGTSIEQEKITSEYNKTIEEGSISNFEKDIELISIIELSKKFEIAE
ncbi:MAG: hypothetical protein IJK26_07945 [Clostridia bacterium]|nr:hypothetical protein [Clostridia bacterium]